jgi:hypothetical protein
LMKQEGTRLILRQFQAKLQPSNQKNRFARHEVNLDET